MYHYVPCLYLRSTSLAAAYHHFHHIAAIGIFLGTLANFGEQLASTFKIHGGASLFEQRSPSTTFEPTNNMQGRRRW